MSDPAGDDPVPSFLAACLAEPERCKRRLPAVVGLLEAEDDATRLAAGWACCAVAAAHPETVAYLARRLSDRLGEGEVTLELTHALDYLADRFPERVEAAMATETAEPGGRDYRDTDRPARRAFTRSHYYDRGPEGTDHGHTRVPDDAGDDPRQRYTDDGPDERARPGSSEDGESDAGDPAAGSGSRDEAPDAEDDAGTMDPRSGAVSSIATRSRFGRLHVLASRTRGRYADTYRALVGRSGEESAVELRILHRPGDVGDHPAFADDCDRQLRLWAAADAHPHVASVLDWGLEPRPWLATDVTGESLADMDDGPPGDPLHDAVALADAVAALHRNDVVHGGVDPGNVAYPEAVLEGGDREPPLLDNPGLVAVYRYRVDPATVLDPRYAAPEYYDRRFGTVDAATDVYGLGAVVYRLFAREPPFSGSFADVRAAVTGDETPVPSEAADGVPAGIDDVVAKATAADKLRRYETVEHLRTELRSLEGEEVL